MLNYKRHSDDLGCCDVTGFLLTQNWKISETKRNFLLRPFSEVKRGIDTKSKTKKVDT